MTPNRSRAFLLPNQAQKHVTVIDGVKRLDMLVQPSVVSAAAPLASLVVGGRCSELDVSPMLSRT